MKKLLLMALIAITTGTSAFANATDINGSTLNHFNTHFAQATNVSWKNEATFDKISFTLNGENIEVFYDLNGDLLATSKTVAFDKLPKKAIETITSKYTYPAYQLTECIEIVNAEGAKNYYISMDKGNKIVRLEVNQSGSVKVFSKESK